MIRALSSSGLSRRSLIAGLDEAVTSPPWISQRFCIRFRSGPPRGKSGPRGLDSSRVCYPTGRQCFPVGSASLGESSFSLVGLKTWMRNGLAHPSDIATFSPSKSCFSLQCGRIIRGPTPAAENTSNQLPHYPDLHLCSVDKRFSWRANLHSEQLTIFQSPSVHLVNLSILGLIMFDEDHYQAFLLILKTSLIAQKR